MILVYLQHTSGYNQLIDVQPLQQSDFVIHLGNRDGYVEIAFFWRLFFDLRAASAACNAMLAQGAIS